MSFEFDAPEDMDDNGVNYLDDEGTFHAVITNAKEGELTNGEGFDGVTIYIDVLAGTAAGCEGKSSSQSLYSPDLNDPPESQKRSKQALFALFVAGGLMDPSQLGKSTEVTCADLIDKQIVVKLVRKMNKDEHGKWTIPSKFLKISFANIFHVDDPDVASIPKDADALAMIPPEQRHDAAWFDFKKKKGAGVKPAASRSAKDTKEAASNVDVAAMFD